MGFLDKLERKIGKYAIPNLALWLVVGYAIGYVCYYVTPLQRVLYLAMLDPTSVMNGQIWRLITWVIMPPGSSNLFFALIMMIFYYQLGMTLERTWGTFRFNVYIIGGIILTDIGVMVGYWICAALGSLEGIMSISSYVSTYYINMGIFLAFALTYPDNQVLLYFIIPIRMKWLAVVYGALVLVSFLTAPLGGKIVIASSLLNFLIFFAMTKGNFRRKAYQRRGSSTRFGFVDPGQSGRAASGGVRSRTFGDAASAFRHQGNAQPRAIHKCAVCGRTEVSDPNLEFRYCSKCMGNYEYCSEHLFTHTHVR